MTYKPGDVGNPNGSRGSGGKAALRKIHNALNIAISGLGDAHGNGGASEMAVLITAALKDDVIGTLKGLAPFLPKALTVDVTHTNAAAALTDDELAEIIASRAKALRDMSIIDVTPVEVESKESVSSSD